MCTLAANDTDRRAGRLSVVGRTRRSDFWPGWKTIAAARYFRGVYCALLEQWLGADAGAVIPNAGTYTRPALIR